MVFAEARGRSPCVSAGKSKYSKLLSDASDSRDFEQVIRCKIGLLRRTPKTPFCEAAVIFAFLKSCRIQIAEVWGKSPTRKPSRCQQVDITLLIPTVVHAEVSAVSSVVPEWTATASDSLHPKSVTILLLVVSSRDQDQGIEIPLVEQRRKLLFIEMTDVLPNVGVSVID